MNSLQVTYDTNGNKVVLNVQEQALHTAATFAPCKLSPMLRTSLPERTRKAFEYIATARENARTRNERASFYGTRAYGPKI